MDNNQSPQGQPKDSNATNSLGWYCVRSQPKREHMAAARLRQLEGVQVFNPRMRLKKATRRGVVTFVESVFPNYLFVFFDVRSMLDAVKYAPSVSTVVHFGNKIPQIPTEVIEYLRAQFGEEELQEVDPHVQEGDEVVIGQGPFMGMQAKVLRVLTPYQRVEVLLEMLGRTTPVVIDPQVLVREGNPGTFLDMS